MRLQRSYRVNKFGKGGEFYKMRLLTKLRFIKGGLPPCKMQMKGLTAKIVGCKKVRDSCEEISLVKLAFMVLFLANCLIVKEGHTEKERQRRICFSKLLKKKLLLSIFRK